MTKDNFNHKLDRRDFLKIGARVGAGVFLTSYSTTAGATSETTAPTIPTVSQLPTPLVPVSAEATAAEQESKFSAIVPLHAWAAYGELLAQFKAMHPDITVSAIIP